MITLIKIDLNGKIIATYQTNDPNFIQDESDGELLLVEKQENIDKALTGKYNYDRATKKLKLKDQ